MSAQEVIITNLVTISSQYCFFFFKKIIISVVSCSHYQVDA